MDINNNISSRIASSISKLNLTTATRAFRAQEENNKENTPNIELQNTKKDDIQLINKGEIEEKTQNNGINVAEIQQYASYMGENLSIDDINYGLMYGRSVIADFSA